MSASIDDELRWMRKQLDSMIERMAPKPEPRKPRECWVIFPLNYPHPRVIGGATKMDAMLSAVEGGDEVVHMREVL